MEQKEILDTIIKNLLDTDNNIDYVMEQLDIPEEIYNEVFEDVEKIITVCPGCGEWKYTDDLEYEYDYFRNCCVECHERELDREDQRKWPREWW